MSKEADRLIIGMLGWKKVHSGELSVLQPYTRYLLESDGSCTVRFSTGRMAYDFSPSTCDSAALRGIKALAKMGFIVHIHILSTGVSLELVHKHERFRAELCNSLSAALENAMVEKHCTGYPASCIEYAANQSCEPCEKYKQRIKPALLQAMKGGNGE